jgi:hypothetical protein
MSASSPQRPSSVGRGTRLSPLQLTKCITTEFYFRANEQFDRKQRAPIDPKHLLVKTSLDSVSPPEDGKPALWSIELRVRQDLPAGVNLPYEFRITLVGYFVFVAPIKSGFDVLRMVRVNGSSVLYGIAREIVRTNTAGGAWRELLLPTISFYEPPNVKALKPAQRRAAKTQ